MLQQLGFTLDEIIDVLRAHDSGEATEADHRWRLEAVINRIDTKIADLQHTRRTITECRAGRCRFQPADNAEHQHQPNEPTNQGPTCNGPMV